MKANEKRKAEMYKLTDRWRNSGKSQKEVCEEARCSFSVFKYWQKKRKQEQPDEDSGSFIEISSTPKTKLSGFEITYPNGVKLNFNTSFSTSELKALITLY